MSLRLLLAVGLLGLLPVAADEASSLYKKGLKAQKKGDFTGAYVHYSQAVALDPSNDRYRAFAAAVQRRATEGMKIELTAAASTGTEAAEADSLPPLPSIDPGDEYEARKLQPPPELKGNDSKQDLDLTGDPRQLYEQVLKRYGLDVVFDSDFRPGKPTRLHMTQADWRDAIRAIEAITGTFVVAVNERIALVANDTTAKRGEIEPYMSVLVPFDESVTPQEAQESLRAVQSVFDLTKVGVDNTRKLALLRDRVSRLKPALAVFQQMLTHKAQVVVEIEILAAGENSAIRYGLNLPTSFPIVSFTPWGNNVPSLIDGLGYLTFGGGATVFGIGLAGAELFANMTRGSVRSLTKAQLRGVDSQSMTMNVGEKYPVITQQFIGAGADLGPGFASAPTVQFQDLGVNIKVTPRIHNSEEVSIDLEAELAMLTGTALNDIPVIASRRIASRFRMRFDETAVIAGLIRDNRSRGWSGLPLPPPLRSYTSSEDKSELLVTVRPRLVSPSPVDTLTPPIRSGSESRPLTPLD